MQVLLASKIGHGRTAAGDGAHGGAEGEIRWRWEGEERRKTKEIPFTAATRPSPSPEGKGEPRGRSTEDRRFVR